MDEFSDCLASFSSSNSVLIMGDCNIHFDDSNNHQTQAFSALFSSVNLQQMVKTSTHIKGHCFDLIIAREDGQLLGPIPVSNPCISDHLLLSGFLRDKKPDPVKKYLRYRKLKDIDTDVLNSDLQKHLHFLQNRLILWYKDIMSVYLKLCKIMLHLWRNMTESDLTQHGLIVISGMQKS